MNLRNQDWHPDDGIPKVVCEFVRWLYANGYAKDSLAVMELLEAPQDYLERWEEFTGESSALPRQVAGGLHNLTTHCDVGSDR